MYASTDSLDQGDIVYTKGGYQIGKASKSTESAVIGVLSSKPGLLIGADDILTASGRYPVALAGRVPVKVSTEGGNIKPGDKIQLSSIDGVGMNATSSGMIVGIALEAFDGTVGESPLVVDMRIENNATPNENVAVEPSTEPCYASGGGEAGSQNCVTKSKTVVNQAAAVAASQSEANLSPNPAPVTQVAASNGNVKIGKIMLFVNLGWNKLDTTALAMGTGSTTGWFIDETGKLTTMQDVNISGKTLSNVAAIQGALDKWSISADGVLTVADVKAENGTFNNSLQVGNDTKATGVTIFDTVTKAPYCLQVRNGVMESTPGKCAGTTSTTASTGTSTNTGAPTVINPPAVVTTPTTPTTPTGTSTQTSTNTTPPPVTTQPESQTTEPTTEPQTATEPPPTEVSVAQP
jgi:hypothetical protein